MIPPVRWKQIRGFPLYEISEEGQVRISLDHPQIPGHIKTRFRRIYIGDKVSKVRRYKDTLGDNGTVFLHLSTGLLMDHGRSHDRHRDRLTPGNPVKQPALADLMDRNWPGVPYPADWQSDGRLVNPQKRKGRKTVSEFTMLTIMDDERTSSESWHDDSFGLSRAWHDQIHRGKTSLASRLREYGRYALSEENAIYWWDSEKRGQRIKTLIKSDTIGPYKAKSVLSPLEGR